MSAIKICPECSSTFESDHFHHDCPRCLGTGHMYRLVTLAELDARIARERAAGFDAYARKLSACRARLYDALEIDYRLATR